MPQTAVRPSRTGGRINSENDTSLPVPLRLCSVGFKSAKGISHSVDVEAETLYEAAAVGRARLKKDGWIEGLGPATRLEIQVREPGSHHVLSVQQVERWINSVNAGPGETLKKAKLRQRQNLVLRITNCAIVLPVQRSRAGST